MRYCDKCGEMVTNIKGMKIPREIKGKWDKKNLLWLFVLQFLGVEPTTVDLCNKCRKSVIKC